ncbi:MAG: HNH endonuclease [Anaerolineales bacterium]|nr:HNH endonuclease [Anaerolineales bacterium]
MILPESVVKRFWAAVDKRGPDECWEWQLSRSRGYGQLARKRGKAGYKAHRVSWMIAHDCRIPQGMVICHKCDNPACVNPGHLFLGTHRDNMRDMVHKGRAHGSLPLLAGENNPSSVLTWEQVREIRERYGAGAITQTALANEYNVNRTTIAHIIYDVSWRE